MFEDNNLVEQLLNVDCDGYWIVSHNEGLRVAVELARRQQDKPVHLTFHDDWAGAICARSSRFKFMAKTALQLTISALKEVTSFDVISNGMQSYYKNLSGIEGYVCHRYISPDHIEYSVSNNFAQSSIVNVGHIGSLYDKDDFLAFFYILDDYVSSRNKKVILHMWGSHLKISDIPNRLQGNIILHPHLSEQEVIPKLAHCNFVYSMYPMSKKMYCFSKTSLPTKLTSYVKAARPIFGHGPPESSLAEFINSARIGVLWSNKSKSTCIEALEKIFSINPGIEQWEIARERYFGEQNLSKMRRILELILIKQN
jgi:hypothetical protein